MAATFVTEFHNEVHGNPPTFPLVLTPTGVTGGQRMVVFLIQSAIAGNFATLHIQDEGDWTEHLSHSLAVSVLLRTFEKDYDAGADTTVEFTTDGDGLCVLAAALMVVYDGMGDFEQQGDNSGENTEAGLTTALDEALTGVLWYRPNTADPTNALDTRVNTDFAGQLGGSGVVWQDTTLMGPGSVPQYDDPDWDATTKSDIYLWGIEAPPAPGERGSSPLELPQTRLSLKALPNRVSNASLRGLDA